MYTDDLSGEVYNGILMEAEKLIKAIIQTDNYELDDLFWGNPTDK